MQLSNEHLHAAREPTQGPTHLLQVGCRAVRVVPLPLNLAQLHLQG